MGLKPPWEFEDPLCSEIGLDLFYKDDEFEDDRARVHGEQLKAAKICNKCDHILECAEWGINKERWGIWGGLTPKERQNIRRKRRRIGGISIEIELLP